MITLGSQSRGSDLGVTMSRIFYIILAILGLIGIFIFLGRIISKDLANGITETENDID